MRYYLTYFIFSYPFYSIASIDGIYRCIDAVHTPTQYAKLLACFLALCSRQRERERESEGGRAQQMFKMFLCSAASASAAAAVAVGHWVNGT